MSSDRRFKLTSPESHGCYTGKTPSQAAKKAFSYLAKSKKMTKNAKFAIQEMTQGSSKKVRKYVGNRTKLKEPVTRQVGGASFTCKYKNAVYRDYSA